MRQGKIAPIWLFDWRGADIAVHRLCEQSRKRKLRELYNYTALLSAGHPPQVHDWVISDEPNEHEACYLDENDIAKYVLTALICSNSFGSDNLVFASSSRRFITALH
jgi:chromatin modification-related protein VID21